MPRLYLYTIDCQSFRVLLVLFFFYELVKCSEPGLNPMTRLTEMHQEQEEEGEEGKFSVAVIRDTLLFAVQHCWGTDE